MRPFATITLTTGYYAPAVGGGALSDTLIRPSVCRSSRRAAALGYRHADCLQLRHVRTADPSADGRRSAASRTAVGGAERGACRLAAPGAGGGAIRCVVIHCAGVPVQRRSVYELTVSARPDAASSSSLSGTADVVVTVVDVNDNSPAFTFPSAANDTVHVSSAAPPGHVIAHLSARDDDDADNARLTFGSHRATTRYTTRLAAWRSG